MNERFSLTEINKEIMFNFSAEICPPTLDTINIKHSSSATTSNDLCQHMIRENPAGCVYVCCVRKRARGRSHLAEELRDYEVAQNKPRMRWAPTSDASRSDWQQA